MTTILISPFLDSTDDGLVRFWLLCFLQSACVDTMPMLGPSSHRAGVLRACHRSAQQVADSHAAEVAGV